MPPLHRAAAPGCSTGGRSLRDPTLHSRGSRRGRPSVLLLPQAPPTEEFLDACDEEVRRRIDLREFFFTTSFGAVIVVDPVRAAEERKLEKLKRAKENAEHARWSDSHVRDNRTSVTITKDEATTKILFGRARLSDFSSL